MLKFIKFPKEGRSKERPELLSILHFNYSHIRCIFYSGLTKYSII